MTSFEVCPSRVRITRRLSYTELDDLLAREENTGRVVESLLTATPADKGDGEYRAASASASGAVQSQGEGSMSRGYLGELHLLICVCVCFRSTGCKRCQTDFPFPSPSQLIPFFLYACTQTT